MRAMRTPQDRRRWGVAMWMGRLLNTYDYVRNDGFLLMFGQMEGKVDPYGINISVCDHVRSVTRVSGWRGCRGPGVLGVHYR